MTLFVKNTDTAIMGIKATADVIWLVPGIADDGLPILGETQMMQETPELEIRNNRVMYVTAEGDTYPDNQIEDRREDGSVKTPRPLPLPRPITANIAARWRADVAARQTQASLVDWVDGLTDGAYLAMHGLYLRKRDWRINAAHAGDWQVAEHYMDGTKTEDASDGPWAIVGDDHSALIEEALDKVRTSYALENV